MEVVKTVSVGSGLSVTTIGAVVVGVGAVVVMGGTGVVLCESITSHIAQPPATSVAYFACLNYATFAPHASFPMNNLGGLVSSFRND